MKHLLRLIIISSLVVFNVTFGHSQTTKKREKDHFKIGQYVLVRLKDGKKVPGVVVNSYPMNMYYVRQIGEYQGLKRRGRVHRKFISKVDANEIDPKNLALFESETGRNRNK